MSIDGRKLWAPLDDLASFMVAVFGFAEAMGELVRPSVWRAKDRITTYTQLMNILLEFDAPMTFRELISLFTLLVP